MIKSKSKSKRGLPILWWDIVYRTKGSSVAKEEVTFKILHKEASEERLMAAKAWAEEQAKLNPVTVAQFGKFRLAIAALNADAWVAVPMVIPKSNELGEVSL